MNITNQSLHELDKKNYLPTFKRFPLAFIKGRGSRLWDANGKEYIDLLAGIAVNNVGHCHPKVIKAIQEQAQELIHVSNFFVSPPQVALSELLVKLTGLEKVFLTNSGAESVEGAFKIARRYAHAKGRGGKIISMQNSFHGRTLATIATGQSKYQTGFAPIPAGFEQVAFNELEELKSKISDEVAAVILEPIQGEGGINPAKVAYLKAVRAWCTENDILLIFDEIQCGIGRAGHWFAKDHYGVQPDIMTLAKGLGGGFPVGAFLCNEKVSKAIEYGDHGTTFGGNPLAAAAALATLKVISDEKLCTKASKKGAWLKKAFLKLQQTHPCILEVRGMGLMIGVQFDQEVAPIVHKLMEEGIIANATAGSVLRIVPPLNIPQADLETFIDTLEKILKNQPNLTHENL
ncbi:aspartate aminotransferase family protein [Pararhodonellum marinum]|uniref:aspartate aminotransferase family protein n=1 Tax=Pararhodonellum marinum TaxID=2755358 RepID=UPI00188EC359|nr:aspartate aminotransferase family protein [Pararhodonellum marinum]